MADQNNGSKFHFEKTLNIGHLLTTVALIVSATIYVMRIESRIEVMEVTQHTMSLRIDRETGRTEAALAKIERYLQRIEDKIDRKADRP
ncbi:hypothetical protein [Thalassospira aquimaris]|uniref:Uncharacterized protein n=1 Tax=Thalassospira aquimaris TaxID=3037796 RepID=A0ABT6GGJ8_9PROT|nr:hypothetical protein [Thalassospira sp. FZY0004]MDG4721140.1 hypothetical protein [Thalassospira sp. FZY0004]